MHLLSCLHPKTIRNPYTHQLENVSCGHCAACRISKQLLWCKRIEAECKTHNYSVFLTLHYDDAHLKYWSRDFFGNLFDEETGVCFNPVDYGVITTSRDFEFFMGARRFPAVSVRDCQLFVKRLRRKIDYYIKDEKENKKLRYYIASEYGPTTCRPHYHAILWFDSPKIAESLDALLHASWPFDNQLNWSYINSSAAQYVSSYVNCVTHLPQIYQHRLLRPFFLCSKCPPIGSDSVFAKEVSEIFAETAVTRPFYNERRNEYRDVPLWRFMQDSLFPKIPRFGALSHNDRITIYGLPQILKAESCEEFKRLIYQFVTRYDRFTCFRRSSVANYLASFGCDISHFTQDLLKQSDNFVKKLWSISNRVLNQSSLLGYSLDEYVRHIEVFYDKKALYRLKEWYTYQQQVCDEKPLASREFLFADTAFWQKIRNVESYGNLSLTELYQLESYGINTPADFDWLRTVDPHKFSEYVIVASFYSNIERKSSKTKLNNAYLEKNKAKFYNYYRFLKNGKHF